MKIIRQNEKLSAEELKQMAKRIFEDMVKGVVDIEQESLALEAELHSDLEALLLQEGSKQANLWGINLYPDLSGPHFLEYDSMINVRPSANNRSRSVESEELRQKIREIVAKRIEH